MEGGWSVTEVEVSPRSAIARVQMKTTGTTSGSAEARLDLGKVMFLDALPSKAATNPTAFATVLVEKLGNAKERDSFRGKFTRAKTTAPRSGQYQEHGPRDLVRSKPASSVVLVKPAKKSG